MASTRTIAHILSAAPLSLALFVGSVSAECAWVLWNETAGPKLREPSYSIMGAHETKTACESDATSTRRRMVSEYGSTPDSETYRVEKAPFVYTIIRANGSTLFVNRPWCLPSGTDPRPRFKE